MNEFVAVVDFEEAKSVAVRVQAEDQNEAYLLVSDAFEGEGFDTVWFPGADEVPADLTIQDLISFE